MNESRSESPFGRRELMRGLALGGVAVAATGVTPARAVSSLTLDVACLLDTVRVSPAPTGAFPVDSWGTSFIVEGLIYPDGTIPDDPGFDPASQTAIGRRLCRGYLLGGQARVGPGENRPEPHVVSTQSYLLDASAVFPADQIVSEGLEGADTPGWSAERVIVGGTGQYAAKRGTVVQTHIGTNTRGLEPAQPAPNFRFVFSFVD